MSEEDNNISNQAKKLKENSESKDKKPLNIIFHCDKCNRIPLIIPSNINSKMIKYCNNEKMAEVITATDLLNMINIKNAKKKDISKENMKIVDNNIYQGEFNCSLHGKHFINYCSDCSKDICYDCSKEHISHKLIYFSNFLPAKRDIREGNKILSEMKNELKKFAQNSKEIIKLCESLINLKEKTLNSLNAVDFGKLNFNSIMNLKNILKIKIQLNEKPYNIINSLSVVNSNLLESIKKNFEKQKKDLSSKEKSEKNIVHEMPVFEKGNIPKNISNYLNNNINLEKNNIEDLYQDFLNILDNNYEFEDESSINNMTQKGGKTKTNQIINNYQQFNEKTNIFLNLEIKNDLSIPLNNNSEKNKKSKNNNKLSQESYNNGNYVKEINLKEQNDPKPEITKYPYISEQEKSTIMDYKETNGIINLISSITKKKIKKFFLCYRATKDGDNADNFHKKCDYIKNIIIIIQTRKNKKFGGFSSESWDNNTQEAWKKDNQAFIFSLNDYNSYNIINPERALFCHKEYGPIFGNGEIFIPDNFFTYVSTCLENNTYYESKGISFPLNGEKEFYVKEMEAYKVDFE
jgi:hypothetical protein